jgi:hypothetical protein
MISVRDVLEPEELTLIFSNLEHILPINKELEKWLEERLTKWSSSQVSASTRICCGRCVRGMWLYLHLLTTHQTIGDVFLKFAPYLKMYRDYTSRYDAGLEKFNEVQQENSRFDEFVRLESAERRQGGELTRSGAAVRGTVERSAAARPPYPARAADSPLQPPPAGDSL